jgi:putative pyruvate formate lyase activating enzyme
MKKKTVNIYPSYIGAHRAGRLRALSERLVRALASCDLCPRRCGADRLRGEKGFCATGRLAKVYTCRAHRGEEPVISGDRGSGTVFFSCCNMRCVYCQNYRFSWHGEGIEVTAEALAEIFMKMQAAGCHNLNLVTPTHVVPQIVEALVIAVEKGFVLPLVYNTGGYDSPEVIRMLEGVVDIYLPDMRYGDNERAQAFSTAPDYVEVNRAVVSEMFRQVGELLVDDGVAVQGLIIRHLVLPSSVSGTDAVFRYIAQSLSKDVHISLMRQYTPVFNAVEDQLLSRKITQAEYDEAMRLLACYGLEKGWVQDEQSDTDAEQYLGANFDGIG